MGLESSLFTTTAQPSENKFYNITTAYFAAGAFDYFGIETIIEDAIGKQGSHVKITNGECVKAVLCQLLSHPYQSLSGTAEFFSKHPLQALLQDSNATPDALNRAVLGRMLDALYEADPKTLFIKIARKVLEVLNVKAETVHIDSTSFHYHGKTYKEDDCDVELNMGYSRDLHPELNQIISVMLCEEHTHLPIFQQAFSGNTSDHTSFNKVVLESWKLIKEQFNDLKYLVGDSALCTGEIAKNLVAQGIKFVTRVPDSNLTARACFDAAKGATFEEIDPLEPNGSKGLWCQNGKIGEQEVKLLLVNNENLRSIKETTITKHAKKELDELQKKLKKLETNPCKCQKDAEKQITELQNKLKLCKLDDISYEDVQGYPKRGKPAKDAKKVTIAVKVHAHPTIDQDKLKEQIESSIRYVIATNDLKRKWTMKELLGIYKKQSVVERGWRFMKCHKLMVDSLFLRKPSRITALTWIMTITLLIFTASEFLLRQKMQEHKLKIPALTHKRGEERPTMMRFLQYLCNCQVIMEFVPSNGRCLFGNIPPELQQVLVALGREWWKYFTPVGYLPYLRG